MDWTPAQLPSGRHGLPREYVIHSQRTRLLGAAVRIAGTDGYAGMTVSAVIARAGVSRKTFYEFFQDREDIFLAAFDRIADAAVQAARDAYNAEEAWPDRLRSVLSTSLVALADHPHETRLGFVEVLAAGPRALMRRDAVMRTFMQFLEPGYDVAADAATASGEAVTIPPLMPEAIVGSIYEIIYARVLQGRTAELPELLPQLMYCALAPFVGPQHAARHAAASVDGPSAEAASDKPRNGSRGRRRTSR